MIRTLLSGIRNDSVELRLVRALHESGIHVFVIDRPTRQAVEWCRAEGVPHCEHSFKNRVDRRAVALYRDILRRHNVDIIHGLTNRALSTALLAVRNPNNVPPIVACCGLPAIFIRKGHGHRRPRPHRRSFALSTYRGQNHRAVSAFTCIIE